MPRRSVRHNRPRKPRTIKNAIVNMDDVSIGPGEGYINWLKITKTKLAKRELSLMKTRLQILDQVIMNSIETFTHQIAQKFRLNDNNFAVYAQEIRHKIIGSQSMFTRNYTHCVAAILHKWNGCKSSAVIPSFREYFQRSRGWFDSRKAPPMALDFWIPIMRFMQKFADTAAAHFFVQQPDVQRLYAQYFFVLFLQSLFTATMKPPNTRKIWLVPAMVYPIFVSKCTESLRIAFPQNVNVKGYKNIRNHCVRFINHRHSSLMASFYNAITRYFVALNDTSSIYPPSSDASSTNSVVTKHNDNIHGNRMANGIYINHPEPSHNRSMHQYSPWIPTQRESFRNSMNRQFISLPYFTNATASTISRSQTHSDHVPYDHSPQLYTNSIYPPQRKTNLIPSSVVTNHNDNIHGHQMVNGIYTNHPEPSHNRSMHQYSPWIPTQRESFRNSMNRRFISVPYSSNASTVSRFPTHSDPYDSAAFYNANRLPQAHDVPTYYKTGATVTNNNDNVRKYRQANNIYTNRRESSRFSCNTMYQYSPHISAPNSNVYHAAPCCCGSHCA